MAAHEHNRNSANGESMTIAKIVAGLKKLGPTSAGKPADGRQSNEERLFELAEFMQRYSTKTITSALARWPSTDRKSWPSIEDISMFMDNIASQQIGADAGGVGLVREYQRNEFANLAVKVYQQVTKLVNGELSHHQHQKLFGLALKLANGERLSFGVEGREYWTVEQLVERIAELKHFDGYVSGGLNKLAA